MVSQVQCTAFVYNVFLFIALFHHFVFCIYSWLLHVFSMLVAIQFSAFIPYPENFRIRTCVSGSGSGSGCYVYVFIHIVLFFISSIVFNVFAYYFLLLYFYYYYFENELNTHLHYLPTYLLYIHSIHFYFLLLKSLFLLLLLLLFFYFGKSSMTTYNFK